MTERTAVVPRSRSAGARFRAAVAAERPLLIVGAINAYHARLAERSGYRAAFSFYGGANLRGNVNRLDIRRQDCHSASTELFRLDTTLAAVGRRLPAS